jgi:hypothetical protein
LLSSQRLVAVQELAAVFHRQLLSQRLVAAQELAAVFHRQLSLQRLVAAFPRWRAPVQQVAAVFPVQLSLRRLALIFPQLLSSQRLVAVQQLAAVFPEQVLLQMLSSGHAKRQTQLVPQRPAAAAVQTSSVIYENSSLIYA